MSTPVQLRDGIMSDAPALAGLMTQLGYETTTVQMRERLGAILPHQYFATFVAEVGDRVVGMVGAELAPGYEYDGMQCRILALVVDEGFHRNGIGRLLLVQAEAWAESQGAWKMTVNTAHHREGGAPILRGSWVQVDRTSVHQAGGAARKIIRSRQNLVAEARAGA